MIVTRIRPQPKDAYSDPTTSAEAEIEVYSVAPRSFNTISGTINGRGRDGVIVGLSLYAPVGTDIRHTDLIRYQGEKYQVEGEPGVWVNPLTEEAPGIEVALRRAEG